MGKKITPLYQSVGLDTNIFIYYFNQHPTFGEKAKQIFLALTANELEAVTSIITLAELLSLKVSPAKTALLYKKFTVLPQLSFLPVDESIAVEAAKIRRRYGFRLPDAIQLATAIVSGQEAFISNDKRLQKVKDIPVILLDDFSKN